MTVWAGVRDSQDLLADGALADGGDEVLDDLEVDVGFEQRAADLAHRLVDVLLGQPALAAEAAEGLGQAVGEGFEHGWPPWVGDECE